LTFIEDGNPEMIGNLINFTKRGMVFKILDQIQTFQQVGYNFEVIPEMQKVCVCVCADGVGWQSLVESNEVEALLID
jgi:hypothetical protein